MAASSIVVFPFRRAAIMIIFSVAVTAKLARKIMSWWWSLPWKAIFSPSPIFWYPNAIKASRCSSMGLFPILHPPGNGISRAQSRARSAGNRKIPTRIFLILSRLIWVIESLEVSYFTVFPSQITSTQSDSTMERKVITSPIFGTLWMVNFSKKSPAARRGSAAFFEPEIFTVPERDWGQEILSI